MKVSLATTNRRVPGGQLVIGARAMPGNPLDGHKLAAQIAQTKRIVGLSVERAHVDRGYGGHDAEKQRVFVSGQKHGVTATIRHEISWRAGIYLVIGHMKEGGHCGPNFLAGAAGDAFNVSRRSTK